jgi:hypothetical protein
MKTILSLLLFCALLPVARAQGGGFSDLLRSVTGAIGHKEAPAPAGQTAVLGVRGMDEGDAKGSAEISSCWRVGRSGAWKPKPLRHGGD